MVRINLNGYIEKRTSGNKNSNPVWRDWWFPKHKSTCDACYIAFRTLTIPKRYAGKKVRFKIEVMEDVK